MEAESVEEKRRKLSQDEQAAAMSLVGMVVTAVHYPDDKDFEKFGNCHIGGLYMILRGSDSRMLVHISGCWLNTREAGTDITVIGPVSTDDIVEEIAEYRKRDVKEWQENCVSRMDFIK